MNFWEGDNATHHDAPQRLLLLALRALEDRAPNWALIDACLNHHTLPGDKEGEYVKAKDGLRKAITALATRAAKAVESMAGPSPDAGERVMLSDGWEPYPLLVHRLSQQWGQAVERTAFEPRDGKILSRWVWFAHDDPHGDPQATEPWRRKQRCFVEQNPNNANWWRISWASWREGAEDMSLPEGFTSLSADDLTAEAQALEEGAR